MTNTNLNKQLNKMQMTSAERHEIEDEQSTVLEHNKQLDFCRQTKNLNKMKKIIALKEQGFVIQNPDVAAQWDKAIEFTRANWSQLKNMIR